MTYVWFDKLVRWINEAVTPDTPAVIGGDFNVAPDDIDVWDPRVCHGGTHVSERERQAIARLLSAGFVDVYRLHHPESGRYTWWDYRAGNFHKNFGMRIDHLLVRAPLQHRVVWAEIDREARKGKPVPSDHAPLVIDIDNPGCPFDADRASAESKMSKWGQILQSYIQYRKQLTPDNESAVRFHTHSHRPTVLPLTCRLQRSIHRRLNQSHQSY